MFLLHIFLLDLVPLFLASVSSSSAEMAAGGPKRGVGIFAVPEQRNVVTGATRGAPSGTRTWWIHLLHALGASAALLHCLLHGLLIGDVMTALEVASVLA